MFAVLDREPGFERLEARMEEASALLIGAPTKFESSRVAIGRFGARGRFLIDRFIGERGVEVVPFDDEHADAAVRAFHRFGKGRHPARLNFGDCMTYATARVAGRPLLFTGEDFARTDIDVA